jgi:hypothetical protein
VGALEDEVSFELREGGEDVEDERGGVDALLERAELSLPLVEPGESVDTRWRRDGPSRASLHTTSVSPGRSWSRTLSSSGRAVNVPPAVSTNTW